MSNCADEVEEALRLIVELVASTADPAFAVGVQGEVIAWNQAVEGLLRRPAGDALGRPCHEIICGRDMFGNRYCDQHCALHNMAARNEPVRSFEMLAECPDGEKIRVRLHALRVGVGAGHALVHVLHSTTELPERSENQAPLTADPTSSPPTEHLTPRELEVLRLLAAGSSTEDLAETLFISIATVRTHVQRIINKMGAHSKLEAVASAYRLGII
ncbi:MAG: LuxR C-terminal-related transcriptional regulator [Thermoanaerobaculales bacterium]